MNRLPMRTIEIQKADQYFTKGFGKMYLMR